MLSFVYICVNTDLITSGISYIMYTLGSMVTLECVCYVVNEFICDFQSDLREQTFYLLKTMQ